jgi:hypothetical protein
MFYQIPFFPGHGGLIIADKYKPGALEAFDYLLQYQLGCTRSSVSASNSLCRRWSRTKWANESTRFAPEFRPVPFHLHDLTTAPNPTSATITAAVVKSTMEMVPRRRIEIRIRASASRPRN